MTASASYPGFRARVGAVGWDADAWVGGFYPHDLPADWRLTYFNTQFDCVYLTPDEWCDRSAAEIEGWVADTLDRFRFVIELPALPSPEESGRIEVLKARLGATVIDGNAAQAGVLWLEDHRDLRHLAATLGRLSVDRREVYLVSRDRDLDAMERAKTLVGIMGF